MIKKILCENKHRLYIEWETGTVYEKPCINIATNYKIDHIGMLYLCKECYDENAKRRIDSKYMKLKDTKNENRYRG